MKFKLLMLTCTLAALVGCSNGGGTSTSPAALSSISVTPGSVTLALGTTKQFTANGTYSDGTTKDITGSVTWASSNLSIATVTSSGVCSPIGGGSVTISAALSNISGASIVTVPTLTTVTINPSSPSIVVGGTQQFTAHGSYSDGSQMDLTMQVTWSSSSPGVATVSASGLANSLAVGTTTITGKIGGVSGSTTLTVSPSIRSISITPINSFIPVTTTIQFTSMATMSDGTMQNVTSSADWTSSSTATATISNSAGSQGTATAVAIGSTTISATVSGITGLTGLTVTNAVTMTGNWNSQLISTTGEISFLSATLSQTGNAITGQIQVGNPEFDQTSLFPVTGSLDSSGTVHITGTQSQTTISYTGSLSSDQTVSTGTYDISGTSSEQGSAIMFHPYSVAGSTFTGSFVGGDNGSTTLSLTFAATGTNNGTNTTLSGTGVVNGLQLTCGVGTNFVFTGTQSGTNINGILSQNGVEWADLSGALSSNDVTLSGHALLTQGNCGGLSADGTLTNTNPNPVPPGAPPLGPVYAGNGPNGLVTFTIRNRDNGTGVVIVNDTPVYCPAAPTGAYKTPGYLGVVCGGATVPAGSTSIKVDSFANPGSDVAPGFSVLPCATGGSSIAITSYACTYAIYDVPAAGVVGSFSVDFGILTQP